MMKITTIGAAASDCSDFKRISSCWKKEEREEGEEDSSSQQQARSPTSQAGRSDALTLSLTRVESQSERLSPHINQLGAATAERKRERERERERKKEIVREKERE
jgi:hypothetical protein